MVGYRHKTYYLQSGYLCFSNQACLATGRTETDFKLCLYCKHVLYALKTYATGTSLRVRMQIQVSYETVTDAIAHYGLHHRTQTSSSHDSFVAQSGPRI